MEIKNINIVTENEVFYGNLIVKNNMIKSIKRISAENPKANYLLPGFIDSHTHGGYGWDFNSLSKGSLKNADKYLSGVLSEGVTTVIGTTVTCSLNDLQSISNNWSNFIQLDHNKIVAGWYVEGPFISKEKKGAHEEKLIVPVDKKICSYIAKNNKFIKIMAVAPEVKNNLNLIKELSKDFIVSIGHSNASCDIALQAMVNGAKRIIHLYNQTSKFDHRNPGIINMAFLDTPIYCELVSDGFHVAPQVLKNTYDIVGPNRTIIITDSLNCKGLKNGNYKLGNLDVIKTSEICRLKHEGNIAGSVMPFNKQAYIFKKSTHCNWIELAKMTSLNAAKSINIADKVGIIKVNYQADLVIVDKNLNIIKTYKNGNLLFSKGVK